MACNSATTSGTGEAIDDPQNPRDLYAAAYSAAYANTRDQAKIQCRAENPGHGDECGEPVFVSVESIEAVESRDPAPIKIKVTLKIKWNCQQKPPTEAEKTAAIASGCGSNFTVKAESQAADKEAAARAAKSLAGRMARLACLEPCSELTEVGPGTPTDLGQSPPYARYESTYKCSKPAPAGGEGGTKPPADSGKTDKGGGGCMLLLPVLLLNAAGFLRRG